MRHKLTPVNVSVVAQRKEAPQINTQNLIAVFSNTAMTILMKSE
jgi:hypothetical protein